MRKYGLLLAATVFAMSCLVECGCGPTEWHDVWQGMRERIAGTSHSWNAFLDLRLPRLIGLLVGGAALSVAGGVTQNLFHNPLASPCILGITAASSLFVVVVLLMGWHLVCPYAIPAAAVGGGLCMLCVVYRLARSQDRVSVNQLILTGIAISTALVALQGAIVYALRDEWHLIQTITEWEAGSVDAISWRQVHMLLPLAIVGLSGCLYYRREIFLMGLGEEEAMNLGVDVQRIRWRLFLHVALLTGAAIASLGIIAFFSLVMPHIARRLPGHPAKAFVPSCLVLGGGMLTVMDALLRISGVHSLSIGNVSAIVGGVFFLALLIRQRRFVAVGG